ncbi:MAG: hypothetical protein ACRD11_16995 [Terriglobia bacterium]
MTLVEARYLHCRQARYERYRAVVERGHQGNTQLQIAEKVGVGDGDGGARAACAGIPGAAHPQ